MRLDLQNVFTISVQNYNFVLVFITILDVIHRLFFVLKRRFGVWMSPSSGKIREQQWVPLEGAPSKLIFHVMTETDPFPETSCCDKQLTMAKPQNFN